jgi:hypothetical protein
VTNVHGFQFRLFNLSVQAMPFASSVHETQRMNRLISLLSGCICIALAIFTMLLRCFLSVKQRQRKQANDRSKINHRLPVAHLNNLSPHSNRLRHSALTNGMTNTLPNNMTANQPNTGNCVTAQLPVNHAFPVGSDRKCINGNYIVTLPNHSAMISPTNALLSG